MTNSDNNFDFNVLNKLFVLLKIPAEDRRILTTRIVGAILQNTVNQASIDKTKINMMLDKDLNMDKVASYLITQLGGMEAFAKKLQQSTESLLSALVEEFFKMATPEEADEFRQYLKEHNLRVKELGL